MDIDTAFDLILAVVEVDLTVTGLLPGLLTTPPPPVPLSVVTHSHTPPPHPPAHLGTPPHQTPQTPMGRAGNLLFRLEYKSYLKLRNSGTLI